MTLESGARATVEPGEAPAPGSSGQHGGQGGPHTEQTAVNNSGIINQPAGFKGGWDPALSHCHAAPVTRHTLLGYNQAEHALSRRLTIKEARQSPAISLPQK